MTLPETMTDEQKASAGVAAHHLYYAARAALQAGLTRSEWDTFAGFWFGQAAADHAHEVAASAMADALKATP